MTRNATQKAPTAPQAPAEAPVDPLADLRDPEAVDRYQETQPADAGTEDLEPVGLVTQADWDERRGTVIAAWHADTTSVGFLHKGGRCGCHYLAGVALRAALPIILDLEPVEAPAVED